MLSGDKPISSEKDDILGFAPFADALAMSLTEMAPEEGIVISVEGAWGTGKTSAIELTERRLIIRELAREKSVSIEEIETCEWSLLQEDWTRRRDTRRMHIIRFNPWNFSGQDNLVRAFFTEVGSIIGHPPDGPVANAIKKITDYLPTIGTVAGVGGSLLMGGLPAAGVGATAGKALAEGAQRLFGVSQSLEAAKRELGEALRDSGKRIVVIIDDLDRLMLTEMRAMFSLVKSLGDLPNLLYVLSFDRRVVSTVLKAGSEPIEPEFLEKIVQVQLKLPPPWRSEIRALFFRKIDEVIGDVVPNDQSRWQRAFLEAIEPYIQTPRDVARFKNTLQVVWPNVAGDVDLTDLVILTTIQLFEPSVYQSVFENIEELAGENASYEDDKVFASRFVPTSATNAEAAKEALAHLFPKLAKGWDRHSWDGTVYLKKREQRRLCTAEYYRNYFLFGRDPDLVSRAGIESILRAENPSSGILQMIGRLSALKSRKGRSRVAEFLNQMLEAVFASPFLSDDVVVALLDASDDLIKRRDLVWDFFASDNLERLNSILTLGLDPLSPEERVKRIEKIVGHPNGLTLAALVVDRLAGRHGMHGDESRHEGENYLSLEKTEEAVLKMLQRIRGLATARAFFTSLPRPIIIIWIWKRWGGEDEIRAWLSSELESDDSIIELAKCLPDTSYSSSAEGQKEIRSFKATSYEKIMDVEYFKKRLDEVVLSRGNGGLDQIRTEFLSAEETGRSSRYG